MEGENVGINPRKERTSMRKEARLLGVSVRWFSRVAEGRAAHYGLQISRQFGYSDIQIESDCLTLIKRAQRLTLEKKKFIDGVIKVASSIKDPLASFPDFHHYNQSGLCLCLEARRGDKLPRPLKQYIQKLLKLNMEGHYGADWAAEEKVKHREMAGPEARYIFIYKVPSFIGNYGKRSMHTEEHEGNTVGFVHYRFIAEEEVPVLYLYELQLDRHVQGKGLGKFLMQLVELIARKNCMDAIMLTVQKANLSAMLFYTQKLNYCISSISPSRVHPTGGAKSKYEILSKAFNEEGKSKLE